MRFRSIFMATGWVLAGICGGINSVSASNGVFPLVVGDETPISFSNMSYLGSSMTLTVTSPLVCANVGTAIATAIQVKPYFGNLVFGSYSAGTPSDQGPAFNGVAGMSYGANGQQSITLQGDPSLVCYALSATGVRKASRGLFTDNFEGDVVSGFDSSVNVRVVELPNAGNDNAFKYFIDVNIPVVNASLGFVVRDGFDSAVFNRNVSNWCEVSIGTPSCPGLTRSGNVDKAINLPSGQSYSKRFIVLRQLASGVTSVPSSGPPPVIAALFAPLDNPVLKETKLDNNVATGYGNLSDFSPNITAASPSGIVEGGSITSAPFTLTDDTPESNGALLRATVKVDFNGTQVDATVDCGNTTPITATPVTRNCTYSVALPSANFATDTTPGTYAAGVFTNVIITATDPRNQVVTATVPVHVASGDNDAPVFTVSPVAIPDAANNNIPTLTCSLDTFTGPACTGNLAQFLTGVAPAPANAVDEIAAQTAAFVVDTSSGKGGNILCNLDDPAKVIFPPLGAPRISPQGAASNYDLSYTLRGDVGSATCTVNVRDAGSFPTGQTAQTVTKQFRIVVTE